MAISVAKWAFVALLMAFGSEAFPLARYATCPARCGARQSFCTRASCTSCTGCKLCGVFGNKPCTRAFPSGSFCVNNLDTVTVNGVSICQCRGTALVPKYRNPLSGNSCLSCDTRTNCYNAVAKTCTPRGDDDDDDDDDGSCGGSNPPSGPNPPSSDCGGSGKPCCSTAPRCVQGLVCSAGSCAACGSSGDLCCPGATCNSGYVCRNGGCFSTDGDDD